MCVDVCWDLAEVGKLVRERNAEFYPTGLSIKCCGSDGLGVAFLSDSRDFLD